METQDSENRLYDVVILGAPLDENSSFLRGAALAPARIRQALYGGAMNLCAESGLDLDNDSRWYDAGDLVLSSGSEALAQIETRAQHWLAQGTRVLTLGGDHSITYPLLCAYHRHYPTLNVLHLDAHPDLYDEYEGSRISHACPFARSMEEGLATRLVQVGIRTLNPHQRTQAARFGVEIIGIGDWETMLSLHFTGPIYISLDLDVLDPAFAPGVSHHEPGGLSTRDLLTILSAVEGPIVGADIVEYNPTHDPLGTTAMVAAKCWKELLARLLV